MINSEQSTERYVFMTLGEFALARLGIFRCKDSCAPALVMTPKAGWGTSYLKFASPSVYFLSMPSKVFQAPCLVFYKLYSLPKFPGGIS
jgi:hypothetical protein